MKALTLIKTGELAMLDAEKPVPGRGELLVKTKAATICTSDLADIKGSPFGLKLPQILGHEGAGVVEAVGEGVTEYKPGDEVAVHPVMHCGQCASCRRGLQHLCDNMEHLGYSRGGVFAEYFTIRQDKVRMKPAAMSFAVATLMEPVCDCIEALERANVKENSNMLIVGDGPFGILTALIAKIYKPARIILSGRHEYRLSFARGALAINERLVPDAADAILAAAGGEGIDSAIVCVASAEAANTAIRVLRSRGTLALFAALSGMTPIDLFKVHIKELSICGSCNDMDYLDKAMQLLSDPSLDLGGVITHQFPFDKWRDAFEQAENGKETGLKATMLL